MNKERVKERLTEETIEQFLASLQEKGRSQDSVKTYRQTLTALLDFLPEDGQITEETGPAWREWMTDQGLAPRTINARVSVLNSYCQYIGRREWVQEDFFRENGELQPELSRTEYLRLLQTAKLLGKEKSYLLIKTLGGAGLRIQELPQLTAEVVRESVVRSHNGADIDDVPPREQMYVAKAPQSFRYGEIAKLYEAAKHDEIKSIDSAHLCSLYRVPMHIVMSTKNNIKITEPADFYIYRALYEAVEGQQIFGL